MRVSTAISTASEDRAAFGWVDAVVLLAIFGLLWSVLHFGRGMLVHFDESQMPQLSTNLADIPYYAGPTVLRMWIAFTFSLLFTLTVGYAAAKNRTARAFILPALDVLQSVPVLGFLSATVAGFMALFPGSLLGVECASIFAIFTGQVWNMTFGFYHSLVSIPSDMQEAASTYGLNRWQRFATVEVPASMHSLIWNVHVMRTEKVPLLQSRATTLVVIGTLFMLFIGLALPWVPLGQILGFVHLPATYSLWVVFVVAAYLLTVQGVKHFYRQRIGSWL
jgi:NitT/TauT family transport system permease protein